MVKWIDLEDVAQPAAKVAMQILDARNASVRKLLLLAAHEYRADIEHVHQLRVACRRAAASLSAFQPLLQKKVKRLKKPLRHIRRAAGPARDADVLLERLNSEPSSRKCHDFVVAQLMQLREQAQPALFDVASDERLAMLDAGLRKCFKRLRKSANSKQAASFEEFARLGIREVGSLMLDLSPSKGASVSELHQFRIAGKRLRYSIELFHSALPTAFRDDLYPQIVKIQDRLGKLNDHATAQAIYQKWLAQLRVGEQAAQLAQRVVDEHSATIEIRNKFLDWWSEDRTEQLQSALGNLL